MGNFVDLKTSFSGVGFLAIELYKNIFPDIYI